MRTKIKIRMEKTKASGVDSEMKGKIKDEISNGLRRMGVLCFFPTERK